ncbi:MAG TPA: thermonuclease family protein [Microvirga sp.]|nr:thermonuclease family protein [Microvirga sp.]
MTRKLHCGMALLGRRSGRRRSLIGRVALLGFIALSPLSSAAESEVVDGRTAVILDGDTVAFGSERVRIINIEAPGISEPDCEREEIFALRSRQRLAELIRSGPVTIERAGRDHLGRTLARLVLADGREVAAVLVEEGLALPWHEGPEAREARRRHWCG